MPKTKGETKGETKGKDENKGKGKSKDNSEVNPNMKPDKQEIDTDKPISLSKSIEKQLNAKFSTMAKKFKDDLKDIQTMFKPYFKEVEKMEKLMKKDREKKAKAKNNKTGFRKPTKISDEMLTFMKEFYKKPDMEELQSRLDVTNSIIEYIKANNLQNPSARKEIIPDNKLKKLLKVPNNEKVNFFQLQKFISQHIPKNVAK
tara:strand:+ start:1824 stop:2429 length:606 start_codon:yes stop_codon:yes gene_type:complete